MAVDGHFEEPLSYLILITLGYWILEITMHICGIHLGRSVGKVVMRLCSDITNLLCKLVGSWMNFGLYNFVLGFLCDNGFPWWWVGCNKEC